MSRIRKAYETQFRWLLQRVGARRLDEGVRHLVENARSLSQREGISFARGLTRVCQSLSNRPAFAKARETKPPDRFFCDAGLGGLARWLRAGGHEAFWVEGIDDGDLLERAQNAAAAILTTDSMLMERRILRDRVIPSLWIPPTLSIRDQLPLVYQEFHLIPKEPRCMSCGGELLRADKNEFKDRIPPRTYRWLNDYFICARCGKLYWHGTHWSHIATTLEELRAAP